jgi:hypothetical protein
MSNDNSLRGRIILIVHRIWTFATLWSLANHPIKSVGRRGRERDQTTNGEPFWSG